MEKEHDWSVNVELEIAGYISPPLSSSRIPTDETICGRKKKSRRARALRLIHCSTGWLVERESARACVCV